MELNKIERLVEKTLTVKLVSKKRKSYESTLLNWRGVSFNAV
jgi:hypothetical protein